MRPEILDADNPGRCDFAERSRSHFKRRSMRGSWSYPDSCGKRALASSRTAPLPPLLTGEGPGRLDQRVREASFEPAGPPLPGHLGFAKVGGPLMSRNRTMRPVGSHVAGEPHAVAKRLWRLAKAAKLTLQLKRARQG